MYLLSKIGAYLTPVWALWGVSKGLFIAGVFHIHMFGGIHLVPPDSYFYILGLHAFLKMKLNFYRSYLDIDWGIRTVSFMFIGIPLMEDITSHGMM